MTIQLTLTKGQVEVSVLGQFTNLSNTVLMHVDDINEVNRQIQVSPGTARLEGL